MSTNWSNRIDDLFREKKNILSIYLTAGYPALKDTVSLCRTLETSGVDMIEIGFPFSDPLADGPVIQKSSEVALKNGMSLKVLFSQLKALRPHISIPVLLMGYLNPVLQYGIKEFFVDAAKVGIDGIIIPDLPFDVYEESYKEICENSKLHFIHLVTQSTTPERLKLIDKITTGFIYAVSSHAITGGAVQMDAKREAYFEKLRQSKFQHPVLIGFGIATREAYKKASSYTHGAIVGSAYIKALTDAVDVHTTTKSFVGSLRD